MQLEREETARPSRCPQPQRKRAARRTIESGGGARRADRRRRRRRRATARRRAGEAQPGAPRTSPRSAATIRAPAAAARNTRSATERWWRVIALVGARDHRSSLVGLGGLVAARLPDQLPAVASCDFQEQVAEPALAADAAADRAARSRRQRLRCSWARDGALVRWAPVDERGTLGAEASAQLPPATRGPVVRRRRAHGARRHAPDRLRQRRAPRGHGRHSGDGGAARPAATPVTAGHAGDDARSAVADAARWWRWASSRARACTPARLDDVPRAAPGQRAVARRDGAPMGTPLTQPVEPTAPQLRLPVVHRRQERSDGRLS